LLHPAAKYRVSIKSFPDCKRLLQEKWGTLLVAQLVEALGYKLEGRRFDFR